MPQCLLTAGFASTGCNLTTAGTSKDQIWVFNTSEIASYTESSGEITAFTMAAGKTAFKMEVKKGSGHIYEEKQEDGDGGIDYLQGYSAMIADTSILARNFMDSLNGPDLTIVAYRNDGTFGVAGLDEGLQLVRNKKSTVSGELGYDFALEGKGFNYVMKNVFITDAATTISMLDALT